VLPGVAVTHEIAVHTLELVPNTSDQVLICTNSPHAYIMTVQGQPVRRFSSGKQLGAGGDFNCATMSPQGTQSVMLPSFSVSGFPHGNHASAGQMTVVHR
jgi:hypothetical protein